MTREHFAVEQPISGDTYQTLLSIALQTCAEFMLVVRHETMLDASGQEVLHSLAPYIRDSRENDSWPGTRLFDQTAVVNRYSLSYGSYEILAKATDDLAEWVQPALPEDLCFLREDGSVWFSSVTHEHDYLFDTARGELEHLQLRMPQITFEKYDSNLDERTGS